MSSRHLVDPELLPFLEAFPTLTLSADNIAAVRAARMSLLDQIPPVPDTVEVMEVQVPGPEGAPDVRVKLYRRKEGAAVRMPKTRVISRVVDRQKARDLITMIRQAQKPSIVAGSGARRVVYISCHSGSLARDAGLLVREHGVRLTAAGVMDMFPHTTHVEAMAVFER